VFTALVRLFRMDIRAAMFDTDDSCVKQTKSIVMKGLAVFATDIV